MNCGTRPHIQISAASLSRQAIGPCSRLITARSLWPLVKSQEYVIFITVPTKLLNELYGHYLLIFWVLGMVEIPKARTE